MSIEQGGNNPQEALEMAQNNINAIIDKNPSAVAEAMDPFQAEAILQEGATQVAEWVLVRDLPDYNPNYQPNTPKVIYMDPNAHKINPTQDLNHGGSDPLNHPHGLTSQERVQILKDRAHNMRMGG